MALFLIECRFWFIFSVCLTMGSAVFVLPMHMLRAMYNDLQAGNTVVQGFQTVISSDGDDDFLGEKVTVVLDFPRAMSRTGRIQIEACGGRCPGLPEAQRVAVLATVEELRSKYGIFVADYSYVVLSKRRPVFDGMPAALASFRSDYEDLKETMKGCRSALTTLCSDLSFWLGNIDPSIKDDEIIAVSACHGRLADFGDELDKEIDYEGQLVEMLMGCDKDPEFLRRFTETVPMPMVIRFG